ncbi:MAG TPA: hypothetical protein PK733_07720 [Clostridiales bacterium]|nr:hypothetical protein [Clostridiales bacterium]
MRVDNIKEILDAEILVEGSNPDIDVCTACGSDLMSDVMAYGDEKDILLTGLVNPQVIRTAEMMDIKMIVFVRGKKPDKNMMELAVDKSIILMTTRYPMFIACGKLSSAGIRGGSV